jgi:hypothetical protein
MSDVAVTFCSSIVILFPNGTVRIVPLLHSVSDMMTTVGPDMCDGRASVEVMWVIRGVTTPPPSAFQPIWKQRWPYGERWGIGTPFPSSSKHRWVQWEPSSHPRARKKAKCAILLGKLWQLCSGKHSKSLMPVQVATDRDSSVGIATRYGLEGPGIESRWGRYFPHLSGPALGATQPPVQWVPRLSRG